MLSEGEFEKVDDIVEWCEEQGLEWAEVFKFRKVNARKANAGEKVQTTLKDGTKETDERVADDGDWIVSNVDGGGEEWIVTDKSFRKKYEPAGEDGVWKPKGAPMLAAKLPVSIEFKPPMWGGDVQRVEKGGWLLKDKKNPKDIYGIGEEEFKDTYKPVDGKKLEEEESLADEPAAYLRSHGMMRLFYA